MASNNNNNNNNFGCLHYVGMYIFLCNLPGLIFTKNMDLGAEFVFGLIYLAICIVVGWSFVKYLGRSIINAFKDDDSNSSVSSNGQNNGDVGGERQRQEAERERQRAEEKKRRQEAERERQRAEEERQRQEAECERQRAEEERQRQEEAERERQRSEAERKRKENERALAMADRSRRLTEILQDIDIKKEVLVDADSAPTYVKRAIAPFLENPYNLFGISCVDNKDKVNAVLDKLVKLDRIKATASYSPELALNGVSKPKRISSIMQNSIGAMADIKHRLFWFEDGEACKAWLSESYCKEIVKTGPENASYDMFLAAYFHAIVKDSEFMDEAVWIPVFEYYSAVINADKWPQLESRAAGNDLTKGISDSELLDLFKSSITAPLIELVNGKADISRVERLIRIINNCHCEKVDTLVTQVSAQLMDWVKKEAETMEKLSSECDDLDELSQDMADTLYTVCMKYIRDVKRMISMLEGIDGGSARAGMLGAVIGEKGWNIVIDLKKYPDKDKAMHIAGLIYDFCDEEHKTKLINMLGIVFLKKYNAKAFNELDYDTRNKYVEKFTYKDVDLGLIGKCRKNVTINRPVDFVLLDEDAFESYMNNRSVSNIFSYKNTSSESISIPYFAYWHIVVVDAENGVKDIDVKID